MMFKLFVEVKEVQQFLGEINFCNNKNNLIITMYFYNLLSKLSSIILSSKIPIILLIF